MGRTRRILAGALVLLPGVGGMAAWSVASAHAAAAPLLQLSTDTATPGDEIVVRFEGLEGAVATVATCGNGAGRGSPDCDLLGAQSVKVARGEPTLLDFAVTLPPVGCPCVVRAATASDRQVVTAPIALAGVPDGGPIVEAGAAMRSSMHVSAEVEARHQPWPASWASAFGGSAARALVVTVDNRGADARAVRVTAVAGRNRHSGEPLASRRVTVAADTRREVTVPFELPAPAWSDYVVYGDVSSGNEAVSFSAGADNDPWALELLLPIGLLLVAQVIRWRRRGAASWPRHRPLRPPSIRLKRVHPKLG